MFNKTLLVALSLILSACKPISDQNSNNIKQNAEPLCISSQSDCEITTEKARFSVKFSQHKLIDKVKTELPFGIELSNLPDLKSSKGITKVSAHLEGKDMFMGKVPVFFVSEGNDNIYRAESLLANCSEEQMIWRLWITVEVEDQSQTFFVDFTSQRL